MLVVVLVVRTTEVDVRIFVTLEVTVNICVTSAGNANWVETDVVVRAIEIVLVGTGSVVVEVIDVITFKAVFTVIVDVQTTTSSRSIA